MNIYCITFGQIHFLRDCWVEIKAWDEPSARRLAFKVLGDKWAFIYPKREFDFTHFPNGRVGRVLEVSSHETD